MSKSDSDNQRDANDLRDADRLAADIRTIRRSAENLAKLGNRFPAVSKNAVRILASLVMIELNLPRIESLQTSNRD